MPFNYTNFVWRAITARTLFRYFEEWKIWWWWNKNSTKNESLVASNIHHRTYLSAYCGGQCRNTMHFEVMNRVCTKPENPLSTPRARPLYCRLDSSPVSETSQKHFSSMSFKNLFEIYYPTICFMAKQHMTKCTMTLAVKPWNIWWNFSLHFVSLDDLTGGTS